MKKYRKSKKYYRYRNCMFIFSLILFICIGTIYIFKYLNRDTNYVLKINNEYIHKEEFLLYLNQQQRIFEEIGGVDIWYTDFDGIPAKDVAKNNAVNSIILLKAVVYEAEKLGIYLTKEEIEISKEEALILQENVKIEDSLNISLDICEKFEKEKMIEEKVYEYITGTFVVDENDFEKYFENYMKRNNYQINKINLDYIFIKNDDTFDAKQKANTIAKDITANSDFNNFKEEPFIEVHKNVDLEKDMFEKNIEDKIYQLSKNSISNIIEGRDGFYIFKINKILKQNIKEIEDNVRDEYISVKKAEIYSVQTKNWVNKMKVEKNSEILSNI